MHRNREHPRYQDARWLFDLDSHAVVIGKSGTGKSTYLENLILRLNREECNILVLDPHGGVADFALMKSDKNRVLLSGVNYPGSEGIFSGINVLSTTGEPEDVNLICDWLREAFSTDESLSKGTWGPRLDMVFSSVLSSIMLAEKGITLKSFAELLPDGKRLLSFFDSSNDSLVGDYVRTQLVTKRQWSDFITSSMNKLNPLILNPLVRRVISSRDSDSVDLDSCIEGTDNLIVPDLNLGYVGRNSVRVISSLILARIWSVLMRKGETTRKTYIIIDEASIMPEEIIDTLLTQGRKFGIHMILSYQTLGQASKRTIDSIFSNVGSYACFRVAYNDAELLKENLGVWENAAEFQQEILTLNRHTAVVTCPADPDETRSLNSMYHTYGPITVNPPVTLHDYTQDDLNRRKADLLHQIGYNEIEGTDQISQEQTGHDRLIFLFSDYLESRGIRAKIEPNFNGLVPDLMFEYRDRTFFCEVEKGDLEAPNIIAEKMWNYRNSPLLFLLNYEGFTRFFRIIEILMEKTSLSDSYSIKEGSIPRSDLPLSLLSVYVIIYRDRDFYIYNGSDLTAFHPKYLDMEGSFIYRARKLPLGPTRERVLRDMAEIISKKGEIDWADIESRLGRAKFRNLLESINQRGYSEKMSIRALLELDRIRAD